jgi:hypothetical protein
MLRASALMAISSGFALAADFGSTAWPVLQKAGCAGCHNTNGVAASTRFRMPATKLTPARLEEFGRSLHPLVDRSAPDQSPLLTKPTQRRPHGGGKRIDPGSAEEKTLLVWAAELAKADPRSLPAKFVEHPVKPEAPVMRRLTHAQYDATIRDLLGDDSRVAQSFPPEDFVHGFRNQFQAQNASPLLAEAYAGAAEKLSRKAFPGSDARGLIPCPTRDAACRDKFLTVFGRRAFRRPLTPAERTRYARLFAAEPSFFDGARAVVEAMLQSPNFLLRVENGRDQKLRGFETASRLSYFLWNSMPDETLLDAAERGELADPAALDRQIQRMLDSSKAKPAIHEFLGDWLRFDRIKAAVRDRGQYRDFTAELKTAMMEESRRLADHLIWNRGNFMEFFSAGYSFLNAALARLYGVPEPAEEYDRTPLPASTGRAGILGQATFLTLTSKPGDTSPTARGLFIREQFLCQEVPQPPPGVNSNLPPVTKERPMTNRERLAVHLANDSCASCHRLIDPIGLGLEKYDAIGRHRPVIKLTVNPPRAEKNEKPVTFELPIDTAGEVLGVPDSAFTTPRELGRVLAGSEQCQRCVVKQLFRYANGRHEEPGDDAAIDAAYARFRDSGFQFRELMAALARQR